MSLEEANVLDLNELSERLKSGQAAVFPTDTVPALAASPKFSSQLWELKGRSRNKPFILMGSGTEELLEFVCDVAQEDAWKVAKEFWPGALTMVLPTSGDMHHFLNPGSDTIGLRVPNCQPARELLIKSGPLATTSANLSGLAPALSAEGVRKIFPDLPVLGPLPWPNSSGLASTVISWVGPDEWEICRRGAIMPEIVLNR